MYKIAKHTIYNIDYYVCTIMQIWNVNKFVC